MDKTMKQSKEKHQIHKTVRDYCLKHGLSIGRDHWGHYYIPGISLAETKLPTRLTYSFFPTAKSGLKLIKRYRRYKQNLREVNNG